MAALLQRQSSWQPSRNRKTKTMKEPRIHETAVVEDGSGIGPGVVIGPYAVIGRDVKILENSYVGPHTVIEGNTTIGKGCKIFQFASIGAAPQDIRYRGEPTEVLIGEGTQVREFVTIHRGTQGGGGVTRVGSGCMIMAYCHIAHDCQVGDGVIMANGVTLGGHVEIGDHTVIGGLSAIHQFCKIGGYAFLGGMSGVNKDIPPYLRYWGQRGNVYGLNLIGLKRHGFSRDVLKALRDTYRIVFQRKGPLKNAIEEARTIYGESREVIDFLDFIENSKMGVPRAGEEENGL